MKPEQLQIPVVGWHVCSVYVCVLYVCCVCECVCVGGLVG